MNIKDTVWKLAQLADCSVLDATNREAARVAAESLTTIMLLIDGVGPQNDITNIAEVVRTLANDERARLVARCTSTTL